MSSWGREKKQPGQAARDEWQGEARSETQMGLLFGTPAPAAPQRAAAAGRRDTLPAWARAAMPRTPEPAVLPEEQAPGEPVGEPEDRIWRVAELVNAVRGTLERQYDELLVRGEISNLRAAPSGHLYFTLKDGDAQLPAVMFRRQAQLLRFQPEDGLEVLLRGRLSVYEQRGQVQLVAESLEPVGAGSWQVAFEQLKAKLAAEGLFAMDRKRQLPPYPHCVGIVTSPTGAVIRDFLNVTARRHAALDVLLYPAAVQGEGAWAEIVAGIAYFNQARNVDVIVLARGGGSLEDLAPFNSEPVARAIAASTLPVVSAVGHETDFTIADFVADLRAPTPSAAAELITSVLEGIVERVTLLERRMRHAARYACAAGHQRLAQARVEATLGRIPAALGRRAQRLDELRFRMERGAGGAGRQRGTELDRLTTHLLRLEPKRRIADARARMATLEPALAAAARALLGGASRRHDAALRALQTLSPRAVLGRGYALVFRADGALVTHAAATSAGDTLDVQFADTRLRAQVLPAATEDA